MANIRSGSYHITSAALSGAGSVIGRDVDSSINPKKIYSLPFGADPPVWDLEALGNGRYRLSIDGAFVGERDGRLWGFLAAGEGEEWIITDRAHHGAYTIEKLDGTGWVSPAEQPYTQIEVRPLIAAPSDPPYFPAKELWKISPVLSV
ncbi:hypothetical protein BV22DRAFT_1048981 [Leucogyrophana mollusca]|uniref:Uncharacterized protein n=1 Tax=Leucogyrophana mollusca TaxID=85980 RepID=A0ACB8B9F8_9AGAM|nr:hypothetical protein BV22DRAFT_1048981 [Leucogyrophana mollusca]